MSDTPELKVPLPGLIDGDPFEVERGILSVMPVAMDQFAEWIDSASRQLANTERSRILAEHGTSISAERLAELYDESERAGQLARMRGAAKALVGAAAELGAG